MVNVECPGCSAPYSVAEKRIPEGGLKMRCPKCGDSFVVQRPAGAGAPPSPDDSGAQRRMKGTMIGTGQKAGGGPRQLPSVGAPTPPPSKAPLFAAPKSEGAGEHDLSWEPPAPGRDDMGGGADDGFGVIDMALPDPARRGVATAPGGTFDLDQDLPVPAIDADLPMPAAHADLPTPAPGRGMPRPAPFAKPAAPKPQAPQPLAPKPAPAASRPAPVPKAIAPVVKPPAPASRGPAPAATGRAAPKPLTTPGKSPAKAPAAPARGRGAVDFGALDIGLPGGSADDSDDLPTAAIDRDLPIPAHDRDLPVPARDRDLPIPARDRDLPVLARDRDLPLPVRDRDLPVPARDRDLPMAAGDRDLPMAAGDRDLPVAAGDRDLPLVAGDRDLPAPARYGDLPITLGDADLPLPSDSDLPLLAQHGDLPLPADADLPLPSAHGDLPMPGDFNLPMTSAHGDLPARSMQGDLPIPADQDLPLPMAHGDLPVPGDFNLPTTAGTSGDDAIPIGEGFELEEERRMPSAGQLFDAEADDRHAPPRRDESVGGEFAVDQELLVGEPPALDQTPLGDAPRVRIKPKKSRALRIAMLIVPLLALAGGLLSLTSLGPYGYYAISDSLNRERYQQALDAFRSSAQEQLAIDTATEARNLLARARAEQQQMPRYAPMAAYAAYVAFIGNVRFGSDSETMATGRVLLGLVPEGDKTEMALLARAAQAAAENQVGAAQAQLVELAERLPNDVDVTALAGEVALQAKTPKEALGQWKKAAQTARNARTVFGLARTYAALDDAEQAKKHAEETLKLSKEHAGARVLLAELLSKEDKKSERALTLLKEVVSEGTVRSGTSTAELVRAYSRLGELHMSLSHLTDAEKAFKGALELDQRAVSALVGMGRFYMVAGRYSEALAAFESASRADPTDVYAVTGKAQSKINLERAKEAREELDAFAKQTKHPLVGYVLGQAHEALGDRKTAEASYRKAIEQGAKFPEVVMAYVALARLLAARGEGAEAEKVLAEASEKMPQSATLHEARGDTALKAGRVEAALAEFQKALELEPTSSAHFRLGVAFRLARRFDDAAKELDIVTKEDPEFPGLSLERGLLFEATGQLDKAIEAYNAALEKAPDDPDMMLRVGSTQVIAGRPERALKTLRDVYGKRPRSAEVNHFLGRAMLLVGEPAQEALKYLQSAAQFDPNRAEYQLYVAWAANEAGQPSVAEQAINAALELDKDLGDAYWQRGVLLQGRGQTRDALEELKIALEKNPTRYEAYATMARCYMDQTDNAAAEAAWRKAIEGNDRQPEWHFRLGKILMDKSARDEAAPFLRKAVDISEERKHTPGWLWHANFLLGEAIRDSDPKRALVAYREFIRLTTPENAYRHDAEAAVQELAKQLGERP
jgi:predicted Zn finger-like uncharacterized protein